MNLKDLIGDYPILDCIGSLDKNISGLNNDSREIKKGHIFIAQEGYRVNGHQFIDEAVKNGASCIIHQEECHKLDGVTYIRVEDSLDAISNLSNNYYDRPWYKLKMIGITGTNGKTSVTHFIREILETYGKSAGIIGTLGLIMDKNKTQLKNTTPDIRVILKSINKMIDKNMEACIMEVSSHSLALNRVKGIEYDIGVFTNLSKDHLDYHKNMENYFQSKLLLFEKTRKYNIINIDDNYGKRIIKTLPDKPYISYAIDEDGDIIATDIIYNINAVDFNLKYKDKKTPIKLNIPGRFSVYNALASIACGIALDIPLDIIREALVNVKTIKGRFEVLPVNKEYNIIIDFAHTPDGLFNVLSVINEFSKGKIIVVFGAGGDRDRSKRDTMGEVVGSLSDFAVITSDNPRNENPGHIIDDILIGIKKTNVDYKAIINRREAIEYAIDIARDNDIILLAGKGHEEEMIIGNKTIKFDEREIVNQIISK